MMHQDIRVTVNEYQPITVRVTVGGSGSTPQPTTGGGIAGPLTQVIITDRNNGLVDIASIEASFNTEADFTGDYVEKTIPAVTSLQLVANQYTYIAANYNGDSPIYQAITDNTIINHSTILNVCQLYWENVGLVNELHVFYTGLYGLGLPNKIGHRLIHTERFGYESGLEISEYGTRNIQINPGKLWYDGNEINTLQVNTDTAGQETHFYYPVSGVWNVQKVTQYPNTQYSDGTNLQTLTGNKFTNIYVYKCANDTDRCSFILLGGQYNSLSDALAANATSVMPDVIAKQAKFLGRIVIENNGASATRITKETTVNTGQMVIQNHNDLSNRDAANAHPLSAISAIYDETLIVSNQTTPTKKFKFLASSIAEDQTRVITIPDRDITLDNITTSTTTNGTGYLKGNGSAISFENKNMVTAASGTSTANQLAYFDNTANRIAGSTNLSISSNILTHTSAGNTLLYLFSTSTSGAASAVIGKNNSDGSAGYLAFYNNLYGTASFRNSYHIYGGSLCEYINILTNKASGYVKIGTGSNIESFRFNSDQTFSNLIGKSFQHQATIGSNTVNDKRWYADENNILVGSNYESGAYSDKFSFSNTGSLTLADAATINLTNNVATNSTTINAISLSNTTAATNSLNTLNSPSLKFKNYSYTGSASQVSSWFISSRARINQGASDLNFYHTNTDDVGSATRLAYINPLGLFVTNNFAAIQDITSYPSSTQRLIYSAPSSTTNISTKRYTSMGLFGKAWNTTSVSSDEHLWAITNDVYSGASTTSYLNFDYALNAGTVQLPLRLAPTAIYTKLGNYNYALATATAGTAPAPATDDKRIASTTNNLLELANYESAAWVDKICINKTGSIEILRGQYIYERQTLGSDTDGDIRRYSDANNHYLQVRESGNWVTKHTWTW